MGKTKAEIIAEYRELKKENLKLTSQLEHWKSIARKENDRVVDLATKLDEKTEELSKWVENYRKKEETIVKLCIDLNACEKEKTLIQSQRDVLLLDYENMSQEADSLREDLEILQAEVRKIQINEEVTHDQAYEEGYRDARHSYEKAIASHQSEIDRLIDDNDLLHWVLYQIHESQTK